MTSPASNRKANIRELIRAIMRALLLLPLYYVLHILTGSKNTSARE